MKCLRCGNCCKTLLSVVVDDPTKGIVDGNLIVNESTQCKHLKGGKPGEYSCVVHEESWFVDTPCFDFGQIERSLDTPCRTGVHVMEAGRRAIIGVS